MRSVSPCARSPFPRRSTVVSHTILISLLVQLLFCLTGLVLPCFGQTPLSPSGTISITCRVGEPLGNDRYLAYQNERVVVQKDSTQNVIATLAPAQTANAAGAFPASGEPRQTEEIPTIGFCEMVKSPELYFDKIVRLRATYQMATEGQYLTDERCPLSHDHQIGVGHQAVLDEKQRDILNTELRKISLHEYGGRAMVTVVGTLRNASRHDFVWYQYRFDIIRVEKISPVIVPYQGVLQAGMTYRGMVRGDQTFGLSVNPMPRMNEHYAQRLEWINLSEFPELNQLRLSASEQRIVFTVLSDEIKQMTESRWNRTLRCKILRIE